MSNTHLAELIASAMQANCDTYDANRKTRADWSAEQTRLWNLAAKKMVASGVMRLVCPSLTHRVPPYSVRKACRTRTLAVGR